VELQEVKARSEEMMNFELIKSEIARLEGAAAALETELAAARTLTTEQSQTISRLTAELDAARAEIASLTSQLNAALARIRELEAQAPPPPPPPPPPPGPTPGDLSQVDSVWVKASDLAALPTTGAAWTALAAEAARTYSTPNLSNQDEATATIMLAKGLVYARTGNAAYKTQVIQACMAAIGTEAGGRTLAFGRKLQAYVIAADLVKLPAADDDRFKTWLRGSFTTVLDGLTLRSTHEDRPNNWGTHAGASRMAAAIYLRDAAELQRAATVFRGWLGDRAAYAGFSYGELDWQSDPANPVGINPKGAVKNGYNIDGVLPDDQRRGGTFTWPPPYENYVAEALQGALVQALLLHRCGYDVWNWQDQALLRAFRWIYDVVNHPVDGDDNWEPYVINRYYPTAALPVTVPSRPGKGFGYTDWVLGAG
jgi:uncharacterized coiled-coil protein SlyX